MAAPAPLVPVPAPIPTVSASASSTSTLPSTSAPPARSKPNKVHVPSACINCKKAHLACDISRPCKRCVSVGKDDTCRDVEHKKRGRPKLVDKQVEIDTSAWGAQGKEPILSTAAALSKNRAKGKYTKSANYKASRRAGTNTGAPPSSTASTNGASMMGATGPHNPIHTPSTATPSPDTTSRNTSHHDASTTSASSPSSYADRAHHAQYSRQDYHPHHHSSPYSGNGGSGRPLESPRREDKDPFFAQTHYGPTPQPITPQSPVVTLFLSMELFCARVSDESQTMWGYHPHDISNKSLHSIISTEDQGKVGHLQRVLKDALFAAINPADSRHMSQFPFIESTAAVFYQNRPGIMSSLAPGASEVTDVVRVCYANGGSDLYTIRLYIGGGLGTDLIRRMNLEHAYIVCVMTRYVDQHQQQQQQHHYQQQQHVPPHHMTPRSSLDESERIQPVPPRPPRSRPSSLYMDERSASSYPPETAVSIAYSDSNSMASSRTSLPSLPNVFSGSNSAPVPSLSSPLTPNPGALPSSTSETQSVSSSLSSSSTSSASVLSSSSSSSSMPSFHTTSRPFGSSSSSLSGPLPPLRTEPLHKAHWLYEPDTLGTRNPSSGMLQSSSSSGGPHYGYGASSSANQSGDHHEQNSHGYSQHHSSHPFNNTNHPGGGRLPSMLSDPFGAFSAPMGGFGVSKYLSRPEPTTSFTPPSGRHMLPLPGSLAQRSSSMSISQQLPARSLQRDLSTSAYGATFGAQPPPAISTALKRPLADMADRQDRTLDIDSRHQDHHHGSHAPPAAAVPAQSHPSSASSASSTSSSPISANTTVTTASCSSSSPASAIEPSAAAGTTASRSIALDLQTMPPDHPLVDMSKGAVCPIVHGERMKQQQPEPPVRPPPSRPMHAYSTHESNGSGGGGGVAGHGHGHSHGHRHASKGSPPCPWAKESQVWSSSKVHPLEAGKGSNNDGSGGNGGGNTTPFSGSPPPSPHHHPYRPTSSTYTYPSQSHHRRSSGTISRPGATGGSGGNGGNGGGAGGAGMGSTTGVRHASLYFASATHCLSGACGVVCRCHVEDEETRAAKAMEAARKRMSVHSLLC
ncbi:hypothetical protein BGZ73_002705 [Actinomortierella ambigua]|nr:hypothetical protein BGZ73_002705 [Actinomortierella ambigua]